MENLTQSATPPRLLRSTTDRAIAGVCGGLAQYFKVDPALIRILFLVFALAGGASILLYIVLWIAVPSDGGVAAQPVSHAGNETVAIVLIAIGSLWLLANFGAFALVEWRFVWPVALVALGVLLLARRFSR
jgi:phage shock protein C